MKVPQPDIAAVVRSGYIASIGSIRKLKRLWGTTTVNGVEVLNSRRYYYKDAYRPANHEKLFRFLGVNHDLEDFTGEGLRSAWFTLNKSHTPEALEADPAVIVSNLNRMWWDANDGPMPENLTLTTDIVIGRRFDASRGSQVVDWSSTDDAISQSIVDNYESIWFTNSITQEGVGIINKGSVLDTEYKIEVPDEDDLSPDDQWLSVVSRYALRDGGIPFTIKNVEVGLSDSRVVRERGIPRRIIDSTVVVTIEIPYHEFTVSDPIVIKILDDVNAALTRPSSKYVLSQGWLSSNAAITRAELKKSVFVDTAEDNDEEDSVGLITRNYIAWEDATTQTSTYNALWYEYDGVWYLRADVFDDPRSYGITSRELRVYVFALIDTGYKKKKVKWYKKLLAVVVFVVAVFLAIPTGGASLTWAYAAVVAFAVTMGALALSVVAALFSALDQADWASAFASVSKTIEPLVMVASVILIVNFAATMGKKLAEMSLTEGLYAIADNFSKDFIDIAAGDISTRAVLGASTKVLQAYTKLQNNKLEDINSRNKDLKTEYDGLVSEMERESDAMMGFMRIYSRPATADWSMYASTFDTPYERGGGTLAMGNVQRTTKQAMRKSDYKEPMFEDMIFV